MSNHDRFMTFYGKGNYSTCHGSGNAGEQYVCPLPTMGGPIKGPLLKQNPKCGGIVDNMGQLAYCAQAQVGGGCSDGMIFKATGQLGKKKRGCGCKGSGANNKKSKKCECMGKCNCNKHNKKKTAQYTDSNIGNGTPISGFFLDVAAPSVGNRPVYASHTNMSPNTLSSINDNLMNRNVGCRQPFWDEKCL